MYACYKWCVCECVQCVRTNVNVIDRACSLRYLIFLGCFYEHSPRFLWLLVVSWAHEGSWPEHPCQVGCQITPVCPPILHIIIITIIIINMHAKVKVTSHICSCPEQQRFHLSSEHQKSGRLSDRHRRCSIPSPRCSYRKGSVTKCVVPVLTTNSPERLRFLMNVMYRTLYSTFYALILFIFIYLIYQSTAWNSKNSMHHINTMPELNGQCRDTPLKHGQHKW